MSLLCDTRNFQYTIPQVDGLHIHMEGPNTKIMVRSNGFLTIINYFHSWHFFKSCQKIWVESFSKFSSNLIIEMEKIPKLVL